MFVICVLYSKHKRYSQDSQDKEVVQMKYREHKIPLVARTSLSFEFFLLRRAVVISRGGLPTMVCLTESD
jgi:hypothetical protein